MAFCPIPRPLAGLAAATRRSLSQKRERVDAISEAGAAGGIGVRGVVFGIETPAFLAGYELAMRDALEAFGIGSQFEMKDRKVRPAAVKYAPPEQRGLAFSGRFFRQLAAMQKCP